MELEFPVFGLHLHGQICQGSTRYKQLLYTQPHSLQRHEYHRVSQVLRRPLHGVDAEEELRHKTPKD